MTMFQIRCFLFQNTKFNDHNQSDLIQSNFDKLYKKILNCLDNSVSKINYKFIFYCSSIYIFF